MAWNIGREQQSGMPTPQGVPQNKPHVAICIPHFGNVSLEWADQMYAPIKFVPQPDFNKSVKLARGILNLDTERNTLAEYALADTTVTHLLFMDTDVVCENPTDVNTAIRMLLACKAPIASGLYRAKKKEGFPYAMWGKGTDQTGRIRLLEVSSWSGNWVKVDFVGFGFVLIERQVFEKTPKPWFIWDKPEPSEDFVACLKFKEAGFDTMVYTDVKMKHLGQLCVHIDGSVSVIGM